MAVKIQVKRGLETNLPTLSQGEFGFTTDSKKVFIGDGSSNIELLSSPNANYLKNDSDDTTTGNITIDKATPILNLDADTGTSANIYFKSDGKKRWGIYKTNTAEQGSNSGSNLNIYAFADNESNIGSALSIERSTRKVSIGADLYVGDDLTVNDTVSINDSLRLYGNTNSTYVARLDGQDKQITANETNYLKIVDIYNNHCAIDSGITDSGYRIGLAAHCYITDADFKGTLATQYGIWARHGDYGSAAGHINNSYGIFIDTLTSGSSTFGNLYGLYQNATTAKNYFAGKVGIGTTTPSDPLNVIGTIRVGATTGRNTYMDVYGVKGYNNGSHATVNLNADGGNVSVNYSISANGQSPLLIGSENYKVWHEGNDGSGSGLNADKVDNKDVNDSETSTSYLWTAGKIISYVESVVNGLDWQDSVKDKDLSTPPSSPSTGDRYIVASGGTGDWSGHDNDIAEYNGSSWDFTTPTEGTACWVEDEDGNYTYNGSSWVTFGSTQTHNNLSGLQGGTSGQYYHLTSAQQSGLTAGNNTSLHNHDSRYFTETETDARYLRRNATSLPTADNTYDLGDASHRWSDIYAVNFNGTATKAKYADLAEKYTIYNIKNASRGKVISISLDNEYDAEICNEIGSSRVIGVISDNPAYGMNDELKGGKYVALKGRIPCLVQGPVKKGDSLISGNNGIALPLVSVDKIQLKIDTKIFAIANETNNSSEVSLIEVIL